MKYYTYAHVRNDTNKIFYIGKGCGKRAWENRISRRGDHWHRIVNKHGYTIQILAYWHTEEEAYDHEKLLIACFRDMKYQLINKTEGGEGFASGDLNPMKDPTVKQKVGNATRGKKRASGKNRGGVAKGTIPWNKDKKLSAQETGWDNQNRRDAAAQRGKQLTGENNPMYGKQAHNRGVAPSEDTLDKLRASVALVPKITCQCGAIMKKSHLVRWHWDDNGNCRRREPVEK